MHEFSLVQGFHNQLLAPASEQQVAKVLKAEVSVGDGAGSVVESFVFNVLSEVTEGMDLVIESNYGEDLALQRVELE